jgi:hypothetical protein
MLLTLPLKPCTLTTGRSVLPGSPEGVALESVLGRYQGACGRTWSWGPSFPPQPFVSGGLGRLPP